MADLEAATNQSRKRKRPNKADNPTSLISENQHHRFLSTIESDQEQEKIMQDKRA